MCGEHVEDESGETVCEGSSPHVRGAPAVARVVADHRGIIPACAGSTPEQYPVARGHWDHPRMCGEHETDRTIVAHAWGSSPHVRGALQGQAVRDRSGGIIPACAGSTRWRWRRRPCSGDHPRMCGEHKSQTHVEFNDEGSSPHVRGALDYAADGRADAGIIPACAGSTSRCSSTGTRIGDHPRMCGEHRARGRPDSSKSGSSPHVRGALIVWTVLLVSARIIPACAGSTICFFCFRLVIKDHPRMCGEHSASSSHSLHL